MLEFTSVFQKKEAATEDSNFGNKTTGFFMNENLKVYGSFPFIRDLEHPVMLKQLINPELF